MRRLLLLWFAFSSLWGVAQTSSPDVLKDSLLAIESTNEIKNKPVNQVRLDAMLQDLNASKASRLETVNTSGSNAYSVTKLNVTLAHNLGLQIRIKTPSSGASTLALNGGAAKKIFMKPTVQAGSGDLLDETVYDLVYDTALDGGAGGYLVKGAGSGGSDNTFQANVTFSLSGGATFGKYSNGETASWSGLTAVEAILDAATEYIDPAFSAFSISGQATTVEVGTILSGSRTFTWTINANSGTVPTLSLFDNTGASTILSNTANDGSQIQTIITNQLNSTGATQSWKGVGNNTAPAGTFNSSNFVVTARFFRFYGTSVTTPATSADVRGLPSSTFHSGATTFTLATGSAVKFVVALPPGVVISSVTDVSALNADITAQYVLLGTINVLDAGGTGRSYNLYEMNLGAPYSSSHNHSIITAN